MEQLAKPPIAAVLQRYGAEDIPGGNRGWRPILCPFHNDTSPSASVNTRLDGFRCHTCGVSGDSWKILMEQEGVNFGEAKRIAQAELNYTGGNVPPAVSKGRKRYEPSWT